MSWEQPDALDLKWSQRGYASVLSFNLSFLFVLPAGNAKSSDSLALTCQATWSGYPNDCWKAGAYTFNPVPVGATVACVTIQAVSSQGQVVSAPDHCVRFGHHQIYDANPFQ